ncbi:hypothetical protein A2U01_0081444, partial [Trifolium medium]|nr:hypothetical protein [Trifolium medium]
DKHVPEEGEDDGELEPVKALDVKYFNRYSAGPQGVPNVEGIHVEEPVNVEEEKDELMEEIDRFEDGVQLDQQEHVNWPYTHSEHEIASL